MFWLSHSKWLFLLPCFFLTVGDGLVLDIQRVARHRNVLPNSLGIYLTISSAGAAMLPAGCSSAEPVSSSGTSCGMLPSSGRLLYCYGNIILFVFTCHSKLKNLTYYFHLIDVHMKKGAIMPYLAEGWVDIVMKMPVAHQCRDAGGAICRCRLYKQLMFSELTSYNVQITYP